MATVPLGRRNVALNTRGRFSALLVFATVTPVEWLEYFGERPQSGEPCNLTGLSSNVKSNQV